jgi:hypothetical protein
MNTEVEEALEQLHANLLKSNEHDEGDLLYFRINYRLAESLKISVGDAQRFHAEYHSGRPRSISRGYCDSCEKLVILIPVIYGVSEGELPVLREQERNARLIVGDTGVVRQGTSAAMFGCSECRKPLPRYGCL